MKKLFLSTFILAFIISSANSQNYWQEYPLTAQVTTLGVQHRLECSVYDSVLGNWQYYQSPYYTDSISFQSNYGKVTFNTWVGHTVKDSIFGYLIYDYELSQFKAVILAFYDSIYPGASVGIGILGVGYSKVYHGGMYNFYDSYNGRYDLKQHSWKIIGTYSGDSPCSGGGTMTGVGASFDCMDDDGRFIIYDPSIHNYVSGGSGCMGWGVWLEDDYVVADNGCFEDYIFGTYDPSLNSWQWLSRYNDRGTQNGGVFTFLSFTGLQYFGVYDEMLNVWKQDSTDNHIFNLQIKDRVAAYRDTVSNPNRLHYLAYSPTLHSWVKDSSDAPGITSFTIQDGTISWTDSSGAHIAGYNDTTGWGNYPTPLFLYFYLTDLFPQTGEPLIHVRNYSIGTDSVKYTFGDGITSMSNAKVLWHLYKSGEPHTVCITDNSGAQSWCQNISTPCFASYKVNPACAGACNGSIEAIALVGQAPFTFLWNTGDTSAILDSLCPGNYTLTVTDSTGCISTNNIILNASVLSTHTVVSCTGLCTGTVSVDINGGIAPFTYQWSRGDTTGVMTNVCTGTYSVLVTDANQCADSVTVTIAQPEVMADSIVSTNAPCHFQYGSATVITTGGTSPYSYNWLHELVTDSILLNASAGTYTVTITDANNCTDTESVTITEPPAFYLFIDSTRNLQCATDTNGLISWHIQGAFPPFTFTWTPHYGNVLNDSIYNLPKGTYTLTATDSTGCSIVNSPRITLSAPSNLILSTTKEDNETCNPAFNGKLNGHVSGGILPYSLLWMPSGDTSSALTNLPSGSYTLVVTDSGGCIDSVTTIVSDIPGLSAYLINVVMASCDTCCDGRASVVTSGSYGYYYNWLPNGSTIPFNHALCMGTNSVIISDTHGCIDTLTVDIINGVNNNIIQGKEIEIYPNPATNQFTVHGLPFTDCVLEIYNVLGEKVYSVTLSSVPLSGVEGRTQTINAKLPAGIYFVRVANEKVTYTQKLVVD